MNLHTYVCIYVIICAVKVYERLQKMTSKTIFSFLCVNMNSYLKTKDAKSTLLAALLFGLNRVKFAINRALLTVSQRQ